MNIKKATVNAYQTTPTGRLVIHLEDDRGECAELVPRMMAAGIDALTKKVSTR